MQNREKGGLQRGFWKALNLSEAYQQYYRQLKEELARLYEVAKKARSRGFDPKPHPEPLVVEDLAQRVEGMVGPKGVAESIRELSRKLPREELAFKIAEEIVYGKFGRLSEEEAAEQAVRAALAILTEGITAAPIEGISRVAIKKNPDGSRYLAIYFAGPIRSAGGTEQALTLVVGDFVRKLLGLDRYKPTEEEIDRFIEELRLHEREVGRFQYHISDQHIRYALERLPVEATGVGTSQVEVSSFRNLQRVETNRLRGGALRVVNDGIVGRAAKVLSVVEKLGLEGWSWLSELKKAREEGKNEAPDFMEEVIAGRPIFSNPSTPGGFRLRYGRARNTGLAAIGVHPAAMHLLRGFIAVGTQLKMDVPGKGGIALPVDYIEPPVALLRDGSVVRVSMENVARVKKRLSRVLFLGDLLISYGDFLYNNRALIPQGYTEEWWAEELREAIQKKLEGSLEKAARLLGIPEKRLKELLDEPLTRKPSLEEAVRICKKLGVPLHPSYTYFWEVLSSEQVRQLRDWLKIAEAKTFGDIITELSGPVDGKVKEILERLCVPHRVGDGKIRIVGDDAQALFFCLNPNVDSEKETSTIDDPLRLIQALSGLRVRPKGVSYLGARMGRPEKAKRREMQPLVHVLFPVGLAGGSQRNLVKAAEQSAVEVELVRRRCPECGNITFRARCENCGVETQLIYACPKCGRELPKGATCPNCRLEAQAYSRQLLRLGEILREACQRLGVSMPQLIKGVKGLTNRDKVPEPVEKGVLRAIYDLSVYKDGTLRFDATNAPLTHFKPAEIGVDVETLKRLGYETDVDGNPLTNENQVCELKVHDIIIPREAAEYLLRVSKFVDELLERFYGVEPYYRAESQKDLVGHLVIGLAPHTSVGVIGRIIGFTDAKVCYAHPLWHSAKRRDCDGDEDSIMLALDVLLNFSRDYLPAKIGGMMDAPLFIIPTIDPSEVQRQAHLFDVDWRYPLKLYEAALNGVQAKDLAGDVDLVADRLGTPGQLEGYGYTVPTSNINAGNLESSYKRLQSMMEKLEGQLALAEALDAVNAEEVALKVLTTHFIRDIAGNLRAYTTQSFRCKKCNKRFRRVPLSGRCPKCGGEITTTVHRGNIEKYLAPARKLIEKYKLPEYYAQRLELIRNEIALVFEEKGKKQATLAEFI